MNFKIGQTLTLHEMFTVLGMGGTVETQSGIHKIKNNMLCVWNGKKWEPDFLSMGDFKGTITFVKKSKTPFKKSKRSKLMHINNYTIEVYSHHIEYEDAIIKVVITRQIFELIKTLHEKHVSSAQFSEDVAINGKLEKTSWNQNNGFKLRCAIIPTQIMLDILKKMNEVKVEQISKDARKGYNNE